MLDAVAATVLLFTLTRFALALRVGSEADWTVGTLLRAAALGLLYDLTVALPPANHFSPTSHNARLPCEKRWRGRSPAAKAGNQNRLKRRPSATADPSGLGG